MQVVPLTLAQANRLVELIHRHHKRAQGHRFSIGAASGGRLVGAAIVGRPVARGCKPYSTAEVTRLVTDGTKNACSFLYSAAARAAREMGYCLIQTYILDSESGVSVEAAGWKFDGETAGGDWNHSAEYAGTRRTDQPMGKKRRYVKILRDDVPVEMPAMPEGEPVREAETLPLFA